MSGLTAAPTDAVVGSGVARLYVGDVVFLVEMPFTMGAWQTRSYILVGDSTKARNIPPIKLTAVGMYVGEYEGDLVGS